MTNYQIIENSPSSRMITIDLDSKLFQEGIIEINDVFTPETVSNWRSALLYFKVKFSPEETQKNPLQIYINSPGGDVYSALGLYDTIKSMQALGYVISTINVGMAASAACFILMAGSIGYRKSLRHCRSMIHTLSSSTYGKVVDLIVDVEEAKNIQEQLNNIIKDCSSEELIEKSQYVDFWMSSEEALNYNVIDKII